MSNCLWPHGLYRPCNTLGQNTEVGSFSLLQGIFPTQGSKPGLLHCRRIVYQLNHKGSPRILEWVAYPVSSGFSQPKNQTGCPALQADSLPTELSGSPSLFISVAYKSVFQVSVYSWKSFSVSCWLWQWFPCKRLSKSWGSVSPLARGQVVMANEAKLCSPIPSTFEVLVVWCAVRHCRREEWGLFCWPMAASGITVFDASHWFAEHTSQM